MNFKRLIKLRDISLFSGLFVLLFPVFFLLLRMHDSVRIFFLHLNIYPDGLPWIISVFVTIVLVLNIISLKKVKKYGKDLFPKRKIFKSIIKIALIFNFLFFAYWIYSIFTLRICCVVPPPPQNPVYLNK